MIAQGVRRVRARLHREGIALQDGDVPFDAQSALTRGGSDGQPSA